MRRVLVCLAGAMMAYPLLATAQTAGPSAPAHVERVARAALEYEDSLWMRTENEVIWSTDRVFNAPPDQIGASIAATRNALSAERARLLALPRPNLRDRDIDLTFIGNALLERRLRRIDLSEAAVGAASSMLDAQRVGDCTAMQTQATEVDRLRGEIRVIGINDENRLHGALAAFGGLPPPPIPVAIDPPPSPETRSLATLTDVFSRALRCPLLGQDLRVEMVARVQADGRIETAITSIGDPSLRDSLGQRLATVRFPANTLRNSPIVNRPVRLVYAGQSLAIAP